MLLEIKEGILKARAALGGTVEAIGDEKQNDKMLQESQTQPKSSIFAPSLTATKNLASGFN